MADLDPSDEVKKIISRQFGIEIDEIEDESEFDKDLGISDLDMEDLIDQINSKFDLAITPEDAAGFKKVSDLVAYIYENAESPA